MTKKHFLTEFKQAKSVDEQIELIEERGKEIWRNFMLPVYGIVLSYLFTLAWTIFAGSELGGRRPSVLIAFSVGLLFTVVSYLSFLNGTFKGPQTQTNNIISLEELKHYAYSKERVNYDHGISVEVCLIILFSWAIPFIATFSLSKPSTMFLAAGLGIISALTLFVELRLITFEAFHSSTSLLGLAFDELDDNKALTPVTKSVQPAVPVSSNALTDKDSNYVSDKLVATRTHYNRLSFVFPQSQQKAITRLLDFIEDNPASFPNFVKLFDYFDKVLAFIDKSFDQTAFQLGIAPALFKKAENLNRLPEYQLLQSIIEAFGQQIAASLNWVKTSQSVALSKEGQRLLDVLEVASNTHD